MEECLVCLYTLVVFPMKILYAHTKNENLKRKTKNRTILREILGPLHIVL